MKSESAPITNDEWLLRRVWYDRFRTGKVPLISPNAFEPRTKGRDIDYDGISLYREACLAVPDDVLSSIPLEKKAQYGVVRIPVKSLDVMGLTVKPDPRPPILGHVVIPELNAVDYRQDAAKFTAPKLGLAKLASEQILIWPASG